MCSIICYIYTLEKTSVDKERQSKRDEERRMSEPGVPWVISNPFHWKIFLMIYTETLRTKVVLFLSQSCIQMCKQE